LGAETAKGLQQSVGPTGIKFSSRVIKQQRRRSARGLCDVAGHGYRHGHAEQLLLAARDYLSRGTAFDAQVDFKSMWPDAGQTPLAIARSMGLQRLAETPLATPALEKA
jgi:hypothetical protein